MTLHDISHDTPADSGSNAPAASEQVARQEAIKQIERRRRFWIFAAMSTLLMVILVVIWAMTEYHNAGGWPTQGFSDSSSIPNVWNDWIIYPAIAWVLFLAADALLVFRNKPISESEIKREIDRQAGQR
jgi:2TM domain